MDTDNQHGRQEKIPVIALQVPQTKPAEAAPVSGWRRTTTACVGFSVLDIVVAFLLGGLYWALNRPGGRTTPVVTQALQDPSITDMSFRTQQVPAFATFMPEPELPTLTPLATQTALAKPSPTLLHATLTPWPTNTIAP